ncbi:MAG: amino acid ABC transporter substrate-binding protein [Burkholderiales bacterium]|nr:MAG: amino acid ABC transporter substrate-binding protein [Burkholderiales bacterium]
MSVKTIASVLLASACLLRPSVGNAELLSRIASAKAVTIAYREASFPFSYLDDQRAPIGYSIDICKSIVEAIRKHLKLSEIETRFIPVTSATRFQAISEGKADLECGSTTNNAARRKIVDFTIPHYISSSRFIVRRADNIKEIEDLRGKRVVSTKGSTNLDTLRKLSEGRLLNLTIDSVDDHAKGFSEVEAGRAYAFAMDDVLLFGFKARAKNPDDFDVIGKALSIEPYAIMFPKGEPTFKRLVDEHVARLALGGELKALYQRWFERSTPPDGINLKLPMPLMLREVIRVPRSTVNDWYLD